MKLTIYKTREFEGEKISTNDVEMELTIDELRISTKAFRKLFKVIKREELNQLLSGITSQGLHPVLIDKLFDLVEDENGELLLFIRRVMAENGYTVSCDQLNTIDPEDTVRILFMMFRLSWDDFKQGFRNKYKNETHDNTKKRDRTQ